MRRALLVSASLALCLGCAESTTRADGGADAGSTRADSGPPGPDAGATICGGFGGVACGADEYCDYPYDRCGGDDGTGVCRPRPEGCPENYDPVCACDGTVYGNACDAAAGGSDLNNLGGCTLEPNTFACGYRFCGNGTYCRVVIDDTGMPPAYECFPFPSSCDGGGMDCTCVAAEPCGEICDETDGNVTVTCPGG